MDYVRVELQRDGKTLVCVCVYIHTNCMYMYVCTCVCVCVRVRVCVHKYIQVHQSCADATSRPN